MHEQCTQKGLREVGQLRPKFCNQRTHTTAGMGSAFGETVGQPDQKLTLQWPCFVLHLLSNAVSHFIPEPPTRLFALDVLCNYANGPGRTIAHHVHARQAGPMQVISSNKAETRESNDPSPEHYKHVTSPYSYIIWVPRITLGDQV